MNQTEIPLELFIPLQSWREINVNLLRDCSEDSLGSEGQTYGRDWFTGSHT